MYPVGVIPFTYASSFVFSNDGVGQTVTIFVNLVIAGIGSMVVYILRIIESTYTIGDILTWVLKILPSYCLNNSIVFAAGKSTLRMLRKDLNVDNFNYQNMGGDLILLGAHFVLWTIVLIALESGVFNCLRTCCTKRGSDLIPNTDLELDDDVVAEEQRVASHTPEQMNIRVQNFRKVY